MIANLMVIAFVAAMAYYWYAQGFFSALLHLAAVILAGVIAFALWEPAAYALLGTNSFLSGIAWGASLILLFAASLFGLRMLLDRYVPGNMQFISLANLLGGAACGLASGVLTAGVVVVGLGFLPLPVHLAGYQPYALSPTGRVDQTADGLWVQVDEIAMGFFGYLSGGAFSPMLSNASLPTHRPGLAEQAALFRLRYDENASLVASPEYVSIEQLYTHGLTGGGIPAEVREALGSEARGGNQLVVVDTAWEQHGAAYDASTLRITPQTQVRLVTYDTISRRPVVRQYAPIAFSKEDVRTGDRRLYPVNTDRLVAFTSDQKATLTWVFAHSTNEQPRFLLIRQLRFPLDELTPAREAAQVVAALGTPPAPETDEAAEDADAGAQAGEREGPRAGQQAREAQLTNDLPEAISQNQARGFRYQGNDIVSGRGTIARFTGRMSENTRLDGVYHPSHLRMIRLQVEVDRARSLLGAARAAAASLGNVTLEDHRGERRQPIAYVWKKSNGDQEIAVDLDNPIRSARQLPLRDMQSEDELYLYFTVSPGVTIQRYWIGSDTSQELELTVE